MQLTYKKYKAFVDFARRTGKSHSITEMAKQELANGKKVAIIAYHYQVYKTPQFKDIDVYSLEQVLKYLGPHVKDYASWKNYTKFSQYDYLYVDPDCYEYMLTEMASKLNELTFLSSQLAHNLRKIAEDTTKTTDKIWE